MYMIGICNTHTRIYMYKTGECLRNTDRKVTLICVKGIEG